MTDHRILRKPGEKPKSQRGLPDLPLVDFHRGAPNLRDVGQGRDLAVAFHQLALRQMPLTDQDGSFLVGLLDRALKDCREDLSAWEAKGKILSIVRRQAEAMEAFESLLLRAPRHEGALVNLGVICRDNGRRDEALAYWRRAVEVSPHAPEYRKNLVLELARRNAWAELQPHCRTWLALDPASTEARRVWVEYLLESGRKGEAQSEFGKLRGLRPSNLAELEAWFARRTR